MTTADVFEFIVSWSLVSIPVVLFLGFLFVKRK